MSGAHWAAGLIGMPYRKGAAGPDCWDCWGLVRHVFATRYGIAMPLVAVADGSADNVSAIKRAAVVSGWRPAAQPAQDGDIVLMQGIEGRHVGVMVEADGRLGLLHAMDGAGVCWQGLRDVAAGGFRDFEVWRHTP